MIPNFYLGRKLKLPGGDPHWANVIALLNMPGADGSAPITDATGRAWTAAGDAQIDTSLGYNTCLLDGSGDYLTSAVDIAGASFGTGAYTVEAWINIPAYKSIGSMILDTLPLNGSGARNNSITFYIASNGTLRCFTVGTDRAVSTGAVPLNTLVHVAQTRAGDGTIRHFIAGTKDGEVALVPTNDNLGGLNVGVIANGPSDTGGHYNGHIKALRITRGVARYTANFTPDAAPWPTS